MQGKQELLVSEADVEALVEQYHSWFGRALTVVPEEFRDRLRAEFSGSWHSRKIKSFLVSEWSSLEAAEDTAFLVARTRH